MPVTTLRTLAICSLVACLTLTTRLPAQTLIEAEASRDNTLYEHSSGSLSNGAGQHLFSGKVNRTPGLRRALIYFNLEGLISPGTSVESVVVTLNMSRTTSGAFDISMHRLLADWGEGSSIASGGEGGGAPSAAGDATWIHSFHSSVLWQSPGGDFEPTASAFTSVNAPGVYEWSSSALAADVERWVNDPSENFGWIFIGAEQGVDRSSKRFDSRNIAVAENRPTIKITVPTDTATEDIVPRPAFDLQIFPNPASGSVTLRFSAPVSSQLRIEMYDLLGRRVLSEAAPQTTSRDTITLATGGLASGRYLVRLISGTESISKIVVVR